MTCPLIIIINKISSYSNISLRFWFIPIFLSLLFKKCRSRTIILVFLIFDSFNVSINFTMEVFSLGTSYISHYMDLCLKKWKVTWALENKTNFKRQIHVYEWIYFQKCAQTLKTRLTYIGLIVVLPCLMHITREKLKHMGANNFLVFHFHIVPLSQIHMLCFQNF